MQLKIIKYSIKIILTVVFLSVVIFLLSENNSTSEKAAGSIWSNLINIPFRINYKVPSDCRCDYSKKFRLLSSYLDSVKNTRKSEREIKVKPVQP